MSEPWILHDPNVPDLPFEDLNRCLEQAALAIRVYLDEDGWTEGVDEIYISRAGIVTHRSTKTVIDRSEQIGEQLGDDPDHAPELDEWWAFSIKEVEPVTGMSPCIESVSSFLDQPSVRIRRTGSDSDMIICERTGDAITYCRDRYPLNVWVDEHFVNVPWFICQPGFDIEINIRKTR